MAGSRRTKACAQVVQKGRVERRGFLMAEGYAEPCLRLPSDRRARDDEERLAPRIRRRLRFAQRWTPAGVAAECAQDMRRGHHRAAQCASYLRLPSDALMIG